MFGNTLGGLIKDYRIRKRISQLDIALKMGWKDTTRLSKIEQGRVSKPKRETIDKLLESLDLDEFERGEFLYNSGYPPTQAEIDKALAEMGPRIDAWPYPAYLMDFTWKVHFTNIPNLDSFVLSHSLKDPGNEVEMHALELPFLPKDIITVDVWKGEDENHLRTYDIAQIAAFKTENYKFQNESWYKNTVKKLMKYDKFRELWPKVGVKEYHKKLLDYEFKRIRGKYNGKVKTLNFHVFTNRIISNPQLQVTMFHPADQATTDFFSKS